MESQTYENILGAIKSTNTQNSQDFATMTLTGSNQGLLNKDPLKSDLTQTGTAIVSQNTVSVRDTSRVKDSTDLVELDWNYKSTTSKPFIVKTGVWTSSQSAGTPLTTFNFPVDYFNTNHVLNQVGNTFLSFRGDLHYVITTLGSPFATGALIASNAYGTIPNFNRADRYFKPHVILDISDNTTTIDFIVPFKWCRNSCSPFDTATKVRLEILEPLQGLTSANYTITAFLENQEFRFLRPTEEGSFRQTQGLFNFTTISNTLSNIEEANLPMEMAGDQYDIGLGMDDIGINNNPQSLLVKFNSLNNSSNPHSVEKVSLRARTLAPSTYDTFNSKVDEMSIAHLFQEREHYHTSFDLTTSTASGVQLMNMAVCPNPSVFQNPALINAAEYIMTNTKFWRGGMKIKLRFFMNRFQAAKVYVGLFYKAITPSTFADWSSSHGVILDVGGDQREVVVEIPYNAETPWLQTLHCSTDVSLPASRELSIFDYIMGQFTVYALTPLVSPEGSPTTITCHVTYSMCEDFQIAGYSTNTRVVQGMDTTVKLSKTSTRTEDNINDTIDSMKDIYRKYELVLTQHNIKLDAPYVATVMSPDWLFCGNTNAAGEFVSGDTKWVAPTAPMTMFGARMFHAYRGGVKVRFDVDMYSIQPDQGKVPWPTNYVPYCIYVNPDTIHFQNGSVTFTNILDNINGSFKCMFDFDSSIVPTPFEVLPVNAVTQQGARIFEVEIPWQRNTKYLEQDRNFPLYKHFGLLMLVFKRQHDDGVGENQFDIRVYAKPADDGRYGIAEIGIFNRVTENAALWGGNNS
jgi:hypothetical protein